MVLCAPAKRLCESLRDSMRKLLRGVRISNVVPSHSMEMICGCGCVKSAR